MADDDILIYSLSEHRDLIFRCLEAVEPRRVVEIGSEAGGMTQELTRWASDRGAHVVTVEPFPVEEVREIDAREEHFSLVEGRSPEALERIEPADAYLIDGDHNYWTVLHELRAIYREGEASPPLAILHDVGWPCARRDQYYSVAALPPEAVRPYSYSKGRVPDGGELVEGGFGGEGGFAVAVEDGGPRNGVLTAVEDFLVERPELRYAHVPAVFGLGVIYAREAGYADSLGEILRPWHENELLARLEQNRVRLYARVLELQGARAQVDSASNRVLLRYAERLAELEAENASLRLERGRLRAELDVARGEAGPVSHLPTR
jgi:Methyltransferase domain